MPKARINGEPLFNKILIFNLKLYNMKTYIKHSDTVDYILDLYNVIHLSEDDELIDNETKNLFKCDFNMFIDYLQENDLQSFVFLLENFLINALEDYNQIMIMNEEDITFDKLYSILLFTFRIIVTSKLLISFNYDIDKFIFDSFENHDNYLQIWWTIKPKILN